MRGYCETDETPQPPTTTTQPGEGLAVATGEPPAMQTSCAWGEEQCGGAGWTGASCCEAGYYCDGAMCAKARRWLEGFGMGNGAGELLFSSVLLLRRS